MTHPSPKAQREFTGWHMLTIMVVFFGVIFSVNLFMATSAVRTWTGLVVENSYVASQQFNTKLANARDQAAKGWQGGLEYGAGTLTFTLVDGDGAALTAQSVTIAMSRPIGTKGDQTLHLTQSANGSYSAPVELQTGVWNAAIMVDFADQPDYEHRARLNVGL